MDPVSEVTLAWLEQRAIGTARGVGPASLDAGTQIALARVVRVGVEDAVRDVVAPGLQESALATLLEDGPAGSSVQVTARASLPRTLVTHLSSRFQALGELGLPMEGRQIADVLTRYIGIRLVGAAGRQVLPPTAMALVAPPGVTVDINDLLAYLNGEDDDEEDGHDDEDAGGNDDSDRAG